MAVSGTLTKEGRLIPAAARVLRIAGLLLMLGGTIAGAPVWWVILTGERAHAMVVRVASATDPTAPRRAYVATLEFDDDGGNPTRIERLLQRPRGGSSLREGATVRVVFPKGQPARADVLHGSARWAGCFTAIFVGSLLIAVTFAGRRRVKTL